MYEVVGFVVFIIFVIFILFLVWLFVYTSKNIVNESFSITLGPSQEVPPVTSPASGAGDLTLGGLSDYVTYSITAGGFSTPAISASFNQAPVGQNGPVVKNLSLVALPGNNYVIQGTWSSLDSTQPLTSDIVNQFKAGNIYVNIATTQYPSGEVRGQVIPLLR